MIKTSGKKKISTTSCKQGDRGWARRPAQYADPFGVKLTALNKEHPCNEEDFFFRLAR